MAPVSPPGSGGSPRSRLFRRYFTVLLLPPLLLYLLPLGLVRLPSFERWGEARYERAVDFAFNPGVPDADVVLFGDSSAMHGVDPRLMEASLHLRVLSLPGTAGSLPVTGDLALRRYLRHNKPPRLIVLYLSPWDLDFGRPEWSSYEGYEILARFGSAADLLRLLRANPLHTLRFPLSFYLVQARRAPSILRARDDRDPFASTRGFAPVTGSAMSSTCLFLPAHRSPQTGSAARIFEQRFRTPQTEVVLVYAPVPGCVDVGHLPPAPALPRAEPPLVLPPGDFLDDGSHSHPLASSVPEVTEHLLDLLRPLLIGPQPDGRDCLPRDEPAR